MKAPIKKIIGLWEMFFTRKEHLKDIEGSRYKLLKMSLHPYEGETIICKDGTSITAGDIIAELHISNLILSSNKVGDVTINSELQLLPIFREEFNHLGKLAAQKKLDPRIKAIWGITLFTPGVRRMGFSVRPMKPGCQTTRLRIWMNFLKWVFPPPNIQHKHKTKSKNRQPHEFYMSINELVEKYG